MDPRIYDMMEDSAALFLPISSIKFRAWALQYILENADDGNGVMDARIVRILEQAGLLGSASIPFNAGQLMQNRDRKRRHEREPSQQDQYQREQHQRQSHQHSYYHQQQPPQLSRPQLSHLPMSGPQISLHQKQPSRQSRPQWQPPQQSHAQKTPPQQQIQQNLLQQPHYHQQSASDHLGFDSSDISEKHGPEPNTGGARGDVNTQSEQERELQANRARRNREEDKEDALELSHAGRPAKKRKASNKESTNN